MHVLIPGNGWGQLSLKPSLQLLEVTQGKGFHLHVCLVVVAALLRWDDWDVQGELKGPPGLLQRVHLVHDPLFRPRLDPVTAGEGVVQDAGSPLVTAFDVVEESILPELREDPDPEWKPGVNGFEETRVLQEYPAIFIYGIGWPLKDGYPHEMRAADYDDWITETVSKDGRPMHGLNGDILVWNPVTKRRHELTSMGIRVNPASLQRQLEITGNQERASLYWHRRLLDGDLPRLVAPDAAGLEDVRTGLEAVRLD